MYCIIGRIEYSRAAGAGYRRSQHKSGSEWALPLSSVHKLRITRSWSNCDKPQIRRFLHVSPKEETITMIWVSRCSSYTTYDKATDIVISQRLGCYYMCHQSLCRHQDTTKLIFSDTSITSILNQTLTPHWWQQKHSLTSHLYTKTMISWYQHNTRAPWYSYQYNIKSEHQRIEILYFPGMVSL